MEDSDCESLLASCLLLLSDRLSVKDVFNVGGVSRKLREVVELSGDQLVQRSIRAEVGKAQLKDNDDDFGVPLMSLGENNSERWPDNEVFHVMLAREGVVLESLTAAKVRQMGRVVHRFKRNVLLPPPAQQKEAEWAHWYSPTNISGWRGGHYELQFREVCGILLVYSMSEGIEYKNSYATDCHQGYVDEEEEFQLALKRAEPPIRNDADIPLSHLPDHDHRSHYVKVRNSPRMTTALVEEFDCRKALRMWVWRRVVVVVENAKDGSDRQQQQQQASRYRRKASWSYLKDSTGYGFALTLGIQFLRRCSKLGGGSRHGGRRRQLVPLTEEQKQVAIAFMSRMGIGGNESVFYGRPSRRSMASKAVGFRLTEEDLQNHVAQAQAHESESKNDDFNVARKKVCM